MSHNDKQSRFLGAMVSVYGPFPTSSTAFSSPPGEWTPPRKSRGHRGRYLWTDALGLLNLLTLHKETNSPDYLNHAKALAQTVHDVLGRTRDGKSRLPGATDENPLAGGLRIGKEDADGEDGDGQYHHYLTLWMFALNRLSLATQDPKHNSQAISLAKAIHPHFFMSRSSDKPRMVWKIAMDMSRPLVYSEGNLDPIDGYVVFRELAATAAANGEKEQLKEEIGDYRRVMERKRKHFVSRDTLDLGMTLWSSHWLAAKEGWAKDLAERCVMQLRKLFDEDKHLERNMRYRLAFREFGTCLGIGCYQPGKPLQDRADEIISSWEKYMDEGTPEDLRPITQVMYAAALIPGAFRAGYFGPEPEVDALA